MQFSDKAGLLLTKGDFVVYAVSVNHHAVLRYAVVLDIVEKETYSGRVVTKLKVQGSETDWNDEPKLLSKASYLMFNECVLRMEARQVPEKHMNLLRDVKLQPVKRSTKLA